MLPHLILLTSLRVIRARQGYPISIRKVNATAVLSNNVMSYFVEVIHSVSRSGLGLHFGGRPGETIVAVLRDETMKGL